MRTPAEQIEEGKRITAEYAATQLPADTKFEWGETDGGKYPLLALCPSRPRLRILFPRTDLLDLPGGCDDRSGADLTEARMKGRVKEAIREWEWQCNLATAKGAIREWRWEQWREELRQSGGLIRKSLLLAGFHPLVRAEAIHSVAAENRFVIVGNEDCDYVFALMDDET